MESNLEKDEMIQQGEAAQTDSLEQEAAQTDFFDGSVVQESDVTVAEPKKAPEQKKVFWTHERSGKLFAYLMVAYPLICFAVFLLFSDVLTLYFSFTDDRTGALTLQNYIDAFRSLGDTSGGDSLFLAFKNTIIWYVAGLVPIPISVLLTYFLFKRIKGFNFFRIMFLMPGIISSMLWVTAFKEITSKDGLLGLLMTALGNPMTEGLFVNPETATPAMIVYNWWLGLAGGMLYYNSAMSRIPDNLFESARLDGCSPMKELVKIVLPLIGPTVGTLLMLGIGGFLSASGPILLFTKGEAGTTTLSFVLYYRVLMNPTGGVGGVSALGMLMTCVSVPLTLFARHMTDKYLPAVEY